MKKNKKRKKKIIKKKKPQKKTKRSSKRTKIKKKSKKRLKKITKKRSQKQQSFLAKFIFLQESIKSKLRIKINLNPEKKIQSFFDFIEKKIIDTRKLIIEEKQKFKIREVEKERQQKREAEKAKIDILKKQVELKKNELKEEKQLQKERARDLKKFLRQEQALLREEQAEVQRKFLEEIKIEKQIEKFRVREVKELENLERISLKEKRDDYSEIQERIDKLKEKYRLIRDQKIRERLEALGIKTLDEDDRETLLKKEKNYIAARQLVETSLESFYRSASSLVFQLNKRHLTRDMSIFRCIDRRFETGEIFIKWDESNDDEWLILIYIKDNSPEGKIVIEDKCNHEKYFSEEYQSNEIFKASDKMVDSLTQLLYRERSKSVNQSLT
ncbi:hypothetical protein OA523_01055 [Candidatus Pelagibacter sp.]|nr:hypothetical protein [Candidatus Pelagibacter sp.]